LAAREGLEDLLAGTARDALTVVAAADLPGAPIADGVEADPGGLVAPVLDGVPDQVLEYELQLTRASRDGREVSGLDERPLLGDARPDVGDHPGGGLVEVDRLGARVAPGPFGALEE